VKTVQGRRQLCARLGHYETHHKQVDFKAPFPWAPQALTAAQKHKSNGVVGETPHQNIYHATDTGKGKRSDGVNLPTARRRSV